MEIETAAALTPFPRSITIENIMPHTVAVTDDRFGAYEEEKKVFSSNDIELMVFNLGKDDVLPEKLLQANAILCNLFPMSSRIIDRLQSCRIISRYGVGYDNVDVDAATRKKIWVSNVPDYSIDDVTDHVLALMLGCARRIVSVHRRIIDGAWNLQQEYKMRRIRGKILGIIGFGRTGKALYRKASGFGLSEILVSDPYLAVGDPEERGIERVSLRHLVERADFISVHIPLTIETTRLISERELHAMKETAVFINTSRGKVIDEHALADVLSRRPAMTAGIDVFEDEPLPGKSLLRNLDNIILSSHLAYYSEESLSELKTKAAQNVLEVLKGMKPNYPVNQI
jgi:D-3-phosphoglycerate dehydrogenase / 2-oxoglutarate reductase